MALVSPRGWYGRTVVDRESVVEQPEMRVRAIAGSFKVVVA